MLQSRILLLYLIPIVLYIPVLYYLIPLPYAFGDSYDVSFYPGVFGDGFENLPTWISGVIFSLESGGRYRPFWDLYNSITWKIFGTTPYVHIVGRLAFHFGAIYYFSLSFLCFSKIMKKEARYSGIIGHSLTSRISTILPLALLTHIWLFFPNQPVVRLGSQELYTVFFLSVCNYMIARALSGTGGKLKDYSIFLLSYAGLLLCKEPNIAIGLWLLSFLAISFLWKDSFFCWRRQSWLGGVPLILIFLHTFLKIYNAWKITGVGYGQAFSPSLLVENSMHIVLGLFQLETSLLVGGVFGISFILSLCIVIFRIIKKENRRENFFILLLLGEFGSLFIFLSCTWRTACPRYWYPLIPILTTLVAFTFKYIVDFVLGRSKIIKRITILTLTPIVFLAFFVAVNYHHFLWLTVSHLSTRHIDMKLISEIDLLTDKGKCIQIERGDSFRFELLLYYYHEFRPLYNKDRAYQVRDNRPTTDFLTYSSPPRRSVPACEPEKPYYVVEIEELPTLRPYMIFDNRGNDSNLLSWTSRIGSFLQQQEPYLLNDCGISSPDTYQWIIYSKPPGTTSSVN